ncbi:UDP-N-acetylmuramoyl-tripeptide--D-alanyl-D-alanine ligase [Hutsoniella sourekii]|uniref:UDP-N-acetylmuramoyl-tripeptide--D-alanyl-D- alanine ligase n=1 Tax=Hutsoniella sourekii TaxID=87650 RepID=UPI000482C861|nr:UDP-N-acetylmuramoyl-tripeptide--D-alanyl-D-alanine ligase [Hutsoniella sourekii]
MQAMKLRDILANIDHSECLASNLDLEIQGVEFDSRKVKAGDLFVPLTGGASDGHSYIQAAIDQGAVACFWSASADQAPSDQLAVIVVEDTLKAMQELAHYYRQVLDPIVIGITGSNGKTTTKDMTAQVLIAKYHVHKTQGNYNNEIGLPYTLLQMPADTEVVVCEMGMSGFGEIQALSQLAEPDIVAITLIGESHLEHLGSRAGIAQAKLEILQGLKSGGVFFYPGAEPLIQSCWPSLDEPVKAYSFGASSDYDIYSYDIIEEPKQTIFQTNLDPNIRCVIPVIGAYNVNNALIALGIARELEVPIEQAIFQLSQFKLTANRLEWLTTQAGTLLLNDAYNASPTSMRAVLASLSNIDLDNKGKRYAILGDIRELGPDSAQLHRELSDAIDPQAIDGVYLFGPEMKHLYEALLDKYPASDLFYEASDHQVLINRLKADLQPDDMALVKSSFGVDLLQVVTALTGHPTK